MKIMFLAAVLLYAAPVIGAGPGRNLCTPLDAYQGQRTDATRIGLHKAECCSSGVETDYLLSIKDRSGKAYYLLHASGGNANSVVDNYMLVARNDDSDSIDLAQGGGSVDKCDGVAQQVQNETPLLCEDAGYTDIEIQSTITDCATKEVTHRLHKAVSQKHGFLISQ